MKRQMSEFEEIALYFFAGMGVGAAARLILSSGIVRGLIGSGVVRQALPVLALGALQSHEPRRALKPRHGYIHPNSLSCPSCGRYNNKFAGYERGWRFFRCRSCGTLFKIHMDEARRLGLIE